MCERLIAEGWDVVCVDSFLTGDESNLAELTAESRFAFEQLDITDHLEVTGDLNWVIHMASPASPRDYLKFPMETLRVGSIGTMNCLSLARDKGAGFLMASTSEVYGDPLVHPQPETYWGNVNPVGPRAVYDEAKRFSEAAAAAEARTYGMKVKLPRIFNTYGPRMRRSDGRAVPEFIDQAIHSRLLTVHGDGTQTRSLCFVDDLIEGIYRFLNSDELGTMNIGNPHEVTVKQLAETIVDLSDSESQISFVERPVDDPQVRCPDITRARRSLEWEPRVDLREGLKRTIEWARGEWS